ncbi:MAG TPA: hypothetical protein VJ917_11165, partial [Saprospiraceae bacterium]|nr:hypothetical protein [Saprospiraceae bacterium]
CLPHSRPPCGLLTGFTNSPVRDFDPLENLVPFVPVAHAGHTQVMMMTYPSGYATYHKSLCLIKET